jgi:hypothetical protein
MLPKICHYYVTAVGNVAIDNSVEWMKKTDAVCGDLFCYDNETTQIKVEHFKQYISTHFKRNKDTIPKTTDTKDFTMLVLNDIHLQMKYKEGTEVQCGQVAGCCEERWGPAKDGKGAGYWGNKDGTCDIPTRTFLKTLEFIKGDFIFIEIN